MYGENEFYLLETRPWDLIAQKMEKSAKQRIHGAGATTSWCEGHDSRREVLTKMVMCVPAISRARERLYSRRESPLHTQKSCF